MKIARLAVPVATLSELATTLPNGFHDAQLQNVVIDYVRGEARLTLDIWVGDMTSEKEREAYRLAQITLGGFLFWINESPDPKYPFDEAGEIRIDSGAVSELKVAPSINLPPVPADAFVSWIYVDEWNCFIYVAARTASLRWMGEKTLRG